MTPTAGQDQLLYGLVDELTTGGFLTPRCRKAFLSVPRHLFIPATIWSAENDDLGAIHRDDDLRRWLEICYENRFIVTQVDDGDPGGPGRSGLMATSSASMPSIVATMLAVLDTRPGQQVLEIGTGTGYNSALLACLVGGENVATIEIDSEVAALARASLAGAGITEVEVVEADGALGHQARAPYDRVIATAACQQVPYPWVAQTRPGGRVLTPWANPYFDGGLLSLTVTEDRIAIGRIVGRSSFMWLREQRVPQCAFGEIVREVDQPAVSSTDIHPHSVSGDYDAQFGIGLQVSRCRQLYSPYSERSGEGILWFLDPWSRSWASLRHVLPDASDAEYRIEQFGPRNLWDEVCAAHESWRTEGSPAVGRWEFTITGEGQQVRLTEGPWDQVP